MSRMPSVSAQDAIKAFEKHGFKFVRKSGSHYIMAKEGHPIHLSIPIHASKPLRIGPLGSLIDDAGLTRDQFLDLLP